MTKIKQSSHHEYILKAFSLVPEFFFFRPRIQQSHLLQGWQCGWVSLVFKKNMFCVQWINRWLICSTISPADVREHTASSALKAFTKHPLSWAVFVLLDSIVQQEWWIRGRHIIWPCDKVSQEVILTSRDFKEELSISLYCLFGSSGDRFAWECSQQKAMFMNLVVWPNLFRLSTGKRYFNLQM